MPRFPPRGPHGRLFPRFNGTIKALRLPAGHPAALRFLRLAVPREPSAVFVSPAAAECQASGLGLVTRYPHPGLLPWRRQDLPSSWGTPIPVCTCSSTPAGRCVPDRDGTLAWPPRRERRRLRRRNLSRLNSMAFGLTAYVSRCWLPVTAQGWLPGAGRALLGGLSPAGLR